MTQAAKKRAGPRATTKNVRTLKHERKRDAVLVVVPDEIPERPRTRGECTDSRPCPWVGCKYHLYLDVNPTTGSIKLNFPALEPWELAETCALDVAERWVPDNGRIGEDRHLTLDEIAEILNVTRERVRQIEASGLASALATLREHEELDG